MRPYWGCGLKLLFWVGLLALCTAGYSALVGPLLRALFGGEGLIWPAWLENRLPPPPDIRTLRSQLPYLILGLSLLKGLAYQRQTLEVTSLGESLIRDLRLQLQRQILRLPLHHIERLGAGDLLSRATQDLEQISRLVIEGWARMIRDGLQILALLTLCFLLDWELALLTFGIYPLAFWPISQMGRRLRRSAGEAHIERGALSVLLHEQLRRLSLIQLMGNPPKAEARFAQASDRLYRALIRAAQLRGLLSPFSEVMGALALSLTLIHTAGRIEAGSLAAEQLFSFFAALLMLYQPAKGLGRSQEVLQPGQAALDRLEEIFQLERIPEGGEGAPPQEPPEISLEGLSLSRGGRLLFQDLWFKFPAAQISLLEGENGAGKSSLLWLLARLLEADEGLIRVNGVPLQELNAEAWRASLGWVLQEPLLKRGSLRENLEEGRIGAADEAAQAAGLCSILKRLPEGWEALLGDTGAGLSGGEKQRLALARALFTKPSFLILDEPEAHLDESAIERLLRDLPQICQGRTVLLISHDPRFREIAHQRLCLKAPS